MFTVIKICKQAQDMKGFQEAFMVSPNKVKRKLLKSRFDKLGWSKTKLCEEVAKVRFELYGDRITKPRTLVTAIDKAMDNPSRASGKTLESIIIAMGGKLFVDWTTDVVIQQVTRQTITGPEDEEIDSEIIDVDQES